MKALLRSSRSSTRPAHFVRRLSSWLVLSTVLTVAARAATTIWGNSTTDFSWDTIGNWNNGVPNSSLDVILPKAPFGPTGSPLTLTAGEAANSLSFFGQYTLTGGDLALTTGQVAVTIGNASAIESKLTGSGGLLKLNDGALKLTNAANNFTGATQIDAGSVIITNQGALGTDASAVVVTGSATRGVGGGSLVVGSANNNLAGLTFTRDLALTGGGASGDGAAFNSVGNNTFTGNIVTGGNVAGLNPIGGTAITASATRLASTFGTATINGNLTVEPSGQSTEFTGNGNWQINANIDGAGNIIKSGNGLLVLAGNNTFGGILQASGGYIRVSSAANLGTNTGNNGIFLTNGGRIEFRTDAPDFTTSKRLAMNTGTTASTIYLDRQIGGSGMNQTVTLGLFTLNASTSTRTLTVDGRNGYNLTFTGNMATGQNQGSFTVNNTGNGLFTNAGNFWGTNSTTARTLTFGSNGDFAITGGIIAVGAAHVVTKSGTGTLTLTGTNSSFSGALNVNGGTVAISDFRAVTNNTAAINIGTTTTTATLSIAGHNLTGANVTTSKVINLAGTTGGAIILANQTGTSPGLIFNANFTASGAGIKTLTLGGKSAQDNTIAGNIVNNSATNTTAVTKIDSGTWVLAGQNAYTGTTTITNGILKVEANAPVSTVLSAANNITFSNNNVNAGGTLEFVGQDGVSNVQALGTLVYASSGGAATVRLTPGVGVGSSASLTFANMTTGGGGTINFVGGDFTTNTITLSQINGSAGADGIVTRSVYWDGADFAYRKGGVLRAPMYGMDGGTATSSSALTASTNNEITGSFATDTISLSTLKINGGQTLTINDGKTLTVTGAGILATGGNAVITGGAIAMTGSATLVVRVNGGADALRIESPFGGATGGLTKSGAGVLVLAAASTQTGAVNIGEGTVRLSGAGTLSGANQTLSIRQDATLDLNGVDTGTAIGQFNNNGTVTNTSATDVTVNIGNGVTTNGTAGTSFGVIEDGLAGGRTSVALSTANNTATQNTTYVFSGLSTYTGATTLTKTQAGNLILNAPTLANIGEASSIGAGDATSTATNAASLVFSGAASATQVFATLNYNGSASLSTDRLFTFGGTVANSGARIRANGVNDATLVFSNLNALAFGTTNLDQDLVLGGASIGSNQFNPRITNNGTGIVSLYKQDAGLWILGNNANSYTGLTTIGGGALRAEGTTLPSASPLVFNGGVLQSGGTFMRSLTASPTAGGGGVHWAGNGGFAAATEKLTVNIGGNVTPDALQWGVGGFVSGTLILSSTTAFAEVDILNPINLSGASQTVQVDTNTTTNSDLATLSGVISGAAGSGLIKTGNGILRLLADNTYVGDTAINAGTIRAVNIGNTSSTASNFGTGAGKISLNNSTLAYVGGGETSDRLIELAGTTSNVFIESSGTGALVLTNVKNVATGTAARTLFLRGDLNAANEITSALDDGAGTGALNVAKDDNGTWILSGQSTFTGNMTVSAGPLGLGADSVGSVGAVSSSPVGVARLIISNGSLFALNGDRTLNTLVRLNSNASSNFIGINSITLNNIETTTGGNMTVTNMLPIGKFLTLNSPTFTGTEALTQARTFVFNGSGDTILNASVTNSTNDAPIALTYQGYGSMTLGGSNGASTYAGATTISSGTFKIGSVDAIPNGAGKNNVTINPAAGLAATLDLNGFHQTVNGLIANSAGTANIDNSSATPVTFTFGSQDQAANLIGGVTNSGGGALSLVKIGTAAATMNQGPFTYTGTTTVSGGSLTIASDVNGTTGITVGAGAFLAFTDGLSGSALVTSVSVGANGELRFLNSLGEPLSNLASLSLGAGTTLGLNAGATSDTLTLLAGNVASVGGAVSLRVRDTGSMLGGTIYNLLEATSGGLITGGGSTGAYTLVGIPGGFTTLTLNQTDTLVSLTTGTLVADKRYWTGASSPIWNDVNAAFDGLNWSASKTGLPISEFIPGSGTTVVFSADNAPGGALVTVLEQGFRINALEFESSTGAATSVAINPGSDPLNRLIISPLLATDGINLKSGGPGSVTISAPLRIDTNQTWTVADSASKLTVSGALGGPGALTTDGPGTIIVSAAAGGTFAVPTVLVNNGTLEIGNVAALGTTVVGNAAVVTINPDAAFYYNGVTGTVNNALVLAGGALSAGTANQTYNGAVDVAANSSINLRDNNSATLSTASRDITLSGQLTGTGKISLDSVNTLSGGNPITGVLILSNDNSGWSGGSDIVRGTLRVQTNLNALGTGNITASGGRIQFNLPANNTLNLGQNFTVDAAGGLLELSVDAQGTLSGDLTVNLNGIVTLGSGANANNGLRISQSSDNFSVLNITNSIVLGNDASISYQGNAVRPFEITGVISETGGARSLAINDELGAWGVTSRTIRLSGANTFTGNISVNEGALEFSTVTNIASAPSNLGQGGAISVGGATLSFIGDTVSQTTNRPITQTGGTSTYSANGTNGASITYAGAISAGANSFTLSGSPGSAGFITSGITTTGTVDANVNGGTWTLTGTTTVGDDLFVRGTDTVLNLNSADALAFNAGASPDATLTIGNGATVNINAAAAVTLADFDRLYVGQDLAGATAVLNLNTFDLSTNRLILGERAGDRNGLINGTGTLTVLGGDFDLYEGTIHANLASTGTLNFDKFGPSTVTLAGNNSGLAATGVSLTIINDGTLVLDYRTNNATKLQTDRQLSMIGGNLAIIGNASAATSQTVGSFTQASGGSNYISVAGSGGQTALLELGAITRGNLAQDGTVHFTLPSGTQTAAHGITTTSPNSNFGLLGTGATATSDSAYATVNDGAGTWFATNDGSGNVVALVSTVKSDVATWAPGDHITGSPAGFSGIVQGSNINSLRFNAASGSDLLLAEGGILLVGSGGVLVTSNAGGSPGIFGGTLASGATEIIITQDSVATFELGADLRINHALTKSGAGTLLVTGNNVNTGYVEIQEGTFQVSGGNAIGDTSLVTLAINRDTLFELLADETIGRLNGGRRATDSEYGTVAIGTHTLTINETGNTTYGGLFTGSGTIVLQGGFDLTTQNISTGFNGAIIVNNGAFRLNNIAAFNATSYTVNSGGTLMIDNTGTTRSGTRILDTAPITLNSADGISRNTGFGTITTVRGLWVRTDQDGTLDETVGEVTARSGASYVSLEATSASDDSDLIANNLVRLNNATINVRGTNLGSTNARNNLFRIGDATNQTAFIATLVGGGGAAGAKNISIVPWAIGEDLGDNALADINMGNSLVTYVSGSGFRPLNLATEYRAMAAAGSADNARESIDANLAIAAGAGGLTTVNGLVLDNNSVAAATHNVTGAGVGQTLALSSGALLFTMNTAAAAGSYGLILGGFDSGITVGGTNEYVIHVVNPSSAAGTAALTATISSPLTSAADITKSGRGTLVLSGMNTAGGGVKKTSLNEGILEISDLDNIGGNIGELVFAGGTLRLGAGLTDDISLRDIFLFNAGGTIDTNGVSLALAGSVGTGLGGITKTGLGTLTLNSAASYTGATAILEGTLAIGANNATGLGGDLRIGAGAALDLGANSISVGLVSASGASPAITGTGTINAAAGFAFTNTGDLTVDAVLAGAGGLFKNQSNILTLSGLNTYAGTTEVQNGTLSFNTIGSIGGGASALGAPTTVEAGIIRMGLTGTSTTLTYTGDGTNSTSNRIIELQGTTGGLTINANGTGAVALGQIQTATTGNKTLTLRGTSDAGLANSIGAIKEVGSTLSVLKNDSNTWVISGTSTHTGATSINDGILRLTVDQSLNGALNFGSANTITTAGALDLDAVDASFGSLLVQTDSTNVNNLTIDAGHTLTINGNVTIGTARATVSNTLLTAAGGGALIVNNAATNGVFAVGGATSAAAVGNKATADFSGLGELTINLDAATGLVRVNPTNANNVNDRFATLILPATGAGNTTITANRLDVGNSGQQNDGRVNALVLGTGANTFNVNTVNIGTGARDFGSVTFGEVSGTLTLRAADGVSAADLNIGTGTATTGVAGATGNTFDVTGHHVDLLLGAVNIGTQAGRTSALNSTFSFDMGLLNMASLTMSTKGSAGATVTTSTFNIGGGTVNSGLITLATTTTATGAAVANLNITGGNVTLTGNIAKGGGAGSDTANLTLDGAAAVLDLKGNAIGSVANPLDNVTFASGTLANLGQFNGGANFIKTSPGVLTMAGVSAYTGETHVNEGTLIVAGELSGTTGVTVASGATLSGSGIINPLSTLTVAGALSPGSSPGVMSTGSVALTSTSTLKLEIGGTAQGSFDQLDVTGSVSLTDAKLEVTLFGDYYGSAMINDTFLVILNDLNDAITGTFAGLAENSTFSGIDGSEFRINYGAGLGNNDVQLTLLAVPEPGAISSLLGGLGMLLGLQRFRRRS